MYCDEYCEGKNIAVDCSKSIGKKKEECIKSCLDCRSPNKKYCYCPEIFPPKPGKLRSLIERSLSIAEENQLNQNNNDTIYIVLVVVVILVVLVGVGAFCFLRYKKWKKTNKVLAQEKPMLTVPEMDQVDASLPGSSQAADNKNVEVNE